MRSLVLLACVALVAAQAPHTAAPAEGQTAEQAGMPVSPVHYIQPVYDNNYAPPAGAAVAVSDCGDSCGAQGSSSGGLITPVYDDAPGAAAGTVIGVNGKPVPATKKARLQNEIVKLAKFVDAIENKIRAVASAVDRSAKPNLAGIKANITIAKNRELKEERRVNASLANGQITQAQAAKEIRALRFIAAQITKCEKALAVISAAKKVPAAQRAQVAKATLAQVAPKVAAATQAAKAVAPKSPQVKKLDNDIVNIARFVDQIEARLKTLASAVDAHRSPALMGVKANITIAKKRVQAERIKVAGRAKELKALDFITAQIAKCEAAVKVISSAKKAAPVKGGKKAQKKAIKKAIKAAKKASKKAKKFGKATKAQKRKEFNLGNRTVGLAKRVDKLKRNLVKLAKRVDQNKTVVRLVRRVRTSIAALEIDIEGEQKRVQKALSNKRLTTAAAEREFKAIATLRAEVAKCKKAADVIQADRMAVKRAAKRRAVVPQGSPAQVKKALAAESLKHAAKIDQLKAQLIKEAKRVDNNQATNELARATMSDIEKVARELSAERTRVQNSKRTGKLTAAAAAAEDKALHIMEKSVAKMRKAASIILTDRIQKKAANSTNPKKREAAKLTGEAVKLAGLIDDIKKALVKDAKKLDKGLNKKSNAAFVASIRKQLATAERMLADERKRVEADFRAKKITAGYHKKQLTALNIMAKQLRRIRKAINIIAKRK